ncbi:MAG: HlyD family secretion protein [Nitrospirae bacterium]|nr:HlyD family secretion protein [Nitrospirota bacterium]
MEETKEAAGGSKKKIVLSIFALIVIAGLTALFFYTRHIKTHITTDDAFIDGDIYTIAPKVSGTVRNVYVRSNQLVKKGDTLVELDEADYSVKVSEAASALEAEKAKAAEIESKILTAKKQLAEAVARVESVKAVNELQNANLEQAEKDRDRAENLYKKQAISKEKYERALTAYKVALAQVRASTEDMKAVTLAVETQKAAIKQAEASKISQLSIIKQKEAVLETAQLNAGYTKINAPADGYVTKKSVEVGNQIKAGQPIMAIVSLDGVYVTANYKETELERVKPGQRVEIEVDTYPSRKFTGRVDSIMAGTGSAFSLFPPENATGNYVKVVQRIPVKILLDKDTDREHVLRVGMSVVPTIVVE